MADEAPEAELIDAWIADLEGWRRVTAERFRDLIREADPDVVEAIKWRKPSNPAGVPVWSHDGILCNLNSLKHTVRLTFKEGASLADPAGVFNAALSAGHMRGIDVREGDEVDGEAVKALVRGAVAFNQA